MKIIMKVRPMVIYAIALAFALALSGVSVYAESEGGDAAVSDKEEIVYAVLSGDGSPEAAYIVNRFRPSTPGEFTDYGDYSKAAALSTTEPVSLDGEVVSFSLGGAPFSYQGDMRDPRLPWLVDIGYRLEGEAISAKELPGADGALEIHISTSPNPDVDKAYFENYVLQITVTLDGDRCSNLAAPDASIASAGSDRTAVFTALPDDDADCTVKADVTDFEMDGIQFAALPFSMAFDLPNADEMTGDMDELVDAVSDLNDGTGELADGAAELADGAKKIGGGAKDVDEGAGKLADGSSGFAKGLKDLDKGSEGLVNGSTVIGKGLKQMSGSMTQLSGGIDLSGLFAALPGFDQTPTGAALKAQIDALNEGLAGIGAGLSALSGNYSSFHEGLVAYTDGVGKLSANYGKLDKSLSQLSGGLGEMADGASGLSKGASELAKGVSTLHDGTSELYDGVSDMPDKVKEKIDEFAADYDKSDYEPRSFASERNKDVSLVQFVFRTETIEKSSETKPADEEPKETTFISRLLSLFGVEAE